MARSTGETDERDTSNNKVLNHDEKGDVSRSWQLSTSAVAAISADNASSSTSDGDKFSAEQVEFRNSMMRMTPHERGAWGERAVIAEARIYEHHILAEHPPDVSTLKGYDCVSWDERTQTLHIWEAKNRSSDSVSGDASKEYNFKALNMEKRLDRVEQFMKDLPQDDPERPKIADAVQHGQVQCHIRVGPDTDVSFTPVERLEWDNLDFKQYSYSQMLKLL